MCVCVCVRERDVYLLDAYCKLYHHQVPEDVHTLNAVKLHVILLSRQEKYVSLSINCHQDKKALSLSFLFSGSLSLSRSKVVCHQGSHCYYYSIRNTANGS